MESKREDMNLVNLDGLVLMLLLHYCVCCIFLLNMFKVVTFEIAYFIACGQFTLQQCTKDHICIVLLSCEKNTTT